MLILEWFKKRRVVRRRRQRLLVLLAVDVLSPPGSLVEICGATGLPPGVVDTVLHTLMHDGLIARTAGLPPAAGQQPRMFFSTTPGARTEAERLAAQLRRTY